MLFYYVLTDYNEKGTDMQLFAGKAFVRKFPVESAGTGKPTTMLLVLVEGDLPSVTDEAMHGLRIEDANGFLTLSVAEAQPTEEFVGLRADQVLTSM